MCLQIYNANQLSERCLQNELGIEKMGGILIENLHARALMKVSKRYQNGASGLVFGNNDGINNNNNHNGIPDIVN